jgi:hypothetical protein
MFVQETAGLGGGIVDIRARRTTSPFAPYRAPAGVAILGAGVTEAARCVDPAPAHELEHLADSLQRGGGQVSTRRVADWWRLGHDADALLEGNRFALDDIAADHANASLSRTTIQGAVVAHGSAVIESSADPRSRDHRPRCAAHALLRGAIHLDRPRRGDRGIGNRALDRLPERADPAPVQPARRERPGRRLAGVTRVPPPARAPSNRRRRRRGLAGLR